MFRNKKTKKKRANKIHKKAHNLEKTTKIILNIFSPQRFKTYTARFLYVLPPINFIICGEPKSHQSFSVFIFMRMLD